MADVSDRFALLHAAGASPARADGLGAALRVDGVELGAAGGLSVLLAIAVAGAGAGAVAVGATVVGAAVSVALACRSLGGRTGDTLGATVSIAEAVMCAALLAVWRA